MAHKGIAKYDEALAKWMEKTNKGEQAGPEPKFEQFTREGELYRQEALRKYEEILRDFPTYERKDEVLFAFAYNKAEIGQKEEAIAKYNELIKQYPNSKYVPDAYVQMGEYFFNTNQLSKARTAYEKALASNNPSIKYFALYKLAWCDFNAGAYEESIKKFKEVIANAKVEKGGVGLKTEALNDIVTSFAQLDAVEEAIGYFKKSTGKDNARRLIAKLADQYQTAGKHDAAVKTFRQLINDDPNDPRCPEFQNAIIVSYEGLRKRDMVAKEMHRLVELYRPNTPWAKANAGNKAAIETAYEITEGAMRTMVTEYHQEAQKTKAADTYRLARDIYKEYLDSFADSEFAYNLRYYYSDILWALNEFEPAAVQYMMVTDKDNKGQYSKMAAFNAILCYERLVEAEKKGKKIEEVTGKVDEKKSKGGAGKTTVKLVTHDKDVKEEEIPKWEQKLVEAIDKSVTLYPGEADEITLRYKAAFVFYDHKHDIDAAKRFGEIINKWPTDQYSAKAADLTLNILETKQEWFELNKLAREFSANKKLVTNNKDFGTRVADLVETSQYKYIDETVYKGQKDPAQAAVKFREFIAEFPKSKLAPQALLYAMIIHHEAKRARPVHRGRREDAQGLPGGQGRRRQGSHRPHHPVPGLLLREDQRLQDRRQLLREVRRPRPGHRQEGPEEEGGAGQEGRPEGRQGDERGRNQESPTRSTTRRSGTRAWATSTTPSRSTPGTSRGGRRRRTSRTSTSTSGSSTRSRRTSKTPPRSSRASPTSTARTSPRPSSSTRSTARCWRCASSSRTRRRPRRSTSSSRATTSCPRPTRRPTRRSTPTPTAAS
ncbi:MAG: tetratricopeptide repeat protein [Myxococcales bacterium]